jgi:hypothetical protein
MSVLPVEIFNDLVKSHGEWFSFDEARSAAATREALGHIKGVMDGAAACLREYFVGGVDITDQTPMRAAWWAVNAVAGERGIIRPLIEGERVADVLTMWSVMAATAFDRVPAKQEGSALRMTAGRLWHLNVPGFKCATTKNGQAVTVLIEIAKAAGDSHVHKDAAHNALRETRPKLKRVIQVKK